MKKTIKTSDSFSTRRYFNRVFEDTIFTLKMNLYYLDINKEFLKMMNEFHWRIKGIQIK